GPHEQRTYSVVVTPNRHMLGRNQVSAVLLYDGTEGNCLGGDAPDGVTPLDLTVVPPGWHAGQPLDAAQGQWGADTKVSHFLVRPGDTVAVSATVRNTGTQEQATNGFGSLVLDCHGTRAGSDTRWQRAQLFDATVVPPGETTSTSFDVTV